MARQVLHTLSAGGSRLQLFEGGALTFSLHGKHHWHTDGPLCVLHYYHREHPRAQATIVPSDNNMGNAGTPSLMVKSVLSITPVSDREALILADLETMQIQVTMRLTLRADGSGFNLTLDPEGLHENHPRLYRILGVEILPEFGAARTGEQGYMTLPNWFGTQFFFDKSYPREVWETIYSSNDQWENVCNMPIFGITRAQGTLCGIVAQGDFDAQLVCRAHWETRQANSVHPYLVYRWQQQDEIMAEPREVRYTFAPPDYQHGEGYVFCGKEYRKFLYKERGLKTWAQKESERPEATDYLDRFFLKIFMAYKDPQPAGDGPYHVCTSFEEVQTILSALLERGVSKLAVMLVGWGQDGHDGKPPTRFPVDERLGGETAMRQLNEWCQAHDIMLGVHDSYGASYTCSPEHNLDDLVHHRTGEYWETMIWSGGQSHTICASVFLEKHTKRDIPKISALGLHGHHHIDAIGAFMPCFSPLHPVPRRQDYVGYIREMFKIASANMGSVSTEMPFGPYFDVVDGFFHSYVHPSPWHLAADIGRYFFDRSVPLLTVTLLGSIKCCQASANLPEMIDIGVSPQHEVCAHASPVFGIPVYTRVLDEIERRYKFFYGPEQLSARINRLTVEGRWELTPEVHETRYSDGTVIRVNQSDQPYEDLQPGEFKLIEPEVAG